MTIPDTEDGTRRVIAVQDRALRARVVGRRPLCYTAGANAALDRPGHVRAGSDAEWVGPWLVVVQDDSSFFALVDPDEGRVVGIPMPAGPGGARQFDDARGNKPDKLDLEAVVSIPQGPDGAVVLAVGSGSAARREAIVLLRGLGGTGLPTAADVEVLTLSRFYAQLRDAAAFAGSELNVEAAVYLGPAPHGFLRLFNRGNGASQGGRGPVNATCDISWSALAAHLGAHDRASPPFPRDIVQYDLGVTDGHPLAFTGAALGPGAGDMRRSIVYTAAAEASPDATRDGPVAGCAVGVIAEGPDGIRARWALLEDADGGRFDGKVEGITLRPGDPMRAHVVLDRDAPDEPAELCDVMLEGPWFTEG